mmetsp:Transcript_17130/g.28690  ORF Transcript_17130/g.28690 Transcript_17130/m.28690 type:complete len:418 (+) Transcript_17130:10-1263(+)
MPVATEEIRDADDEDISDTNDASTVVERERDEVDEMVEAQQAKAQAERSRIMKDFEDKLYVKERAEEARKYANSLFKSDKLSEAAAAYERCLTLCSNSDSASRVVLLANMAAVHLKQWRWRDALQICDEVLKIEPAHPKALYRKAQAYRGLRNTDEALTAIAQARSVMKEAGKDVGCAELDTLEKHVRKDIAKTEAAAAEARGVELRKARRLEQAYAKQAAMIARQHKEETRAAKGRGDWSEMLVSDIVKRLGSDESRMLIQEEDGWVHVTEVPDKKLEVDAQTIEKEDGSCSLTYELSLSLICNCVQMRGTWDDPGLITFKLGIEIYGVSHNSNPETWGAHAFLLQPNDDRSRVKKMMETYVRPRYLSHVKGLVNDSINNLKAKVLAEVEFDIIASAPSKAALETQGSTASAIGIE